MSRIIAGAAGGARLAPVKGPHTRPTTDRVKEALFSRLETYDVLAGARVLDLFAGSGALGLEAASRGAAEVTLVDRDRAALRSCEANRAALERAGSPARITVAASPVLPFLRHRATSGPWDLVFLDPPYDLPEAELSEILETLAGTLADDAVLVAERSARSPEPAWGSSLERFAHRAYGETALWFVEPVCGD
ncbi:16S rRNA (guanine(966)-N(2))-methyltransferase RsmD [Rothia sp. AR01]|uniref:16S rRNA (Guanine(966)-N(2))-methyltransferase RsmD n=1 Tax=Rothia santali TaxID=2949643 RepID=A0A9X2HJW7_9MICC|nr:16S rRNA (guanine(966)-N(2))-methyltransferase RsmD [Rothia santali]MCP3426258.1 16S rRNA (guanine(966)-N(2))-methyltransferase RsmD [Rothia santali]